MTFKILFKTPKAADDGISSSAAYPSPLGKDEVPGPNPGSSSIKPLVLYETGGFMYVIGHFYPWGFRVGVPNRPKSSTLRHAFKILFKILAADVQFGHRLRIYFFGRSSSVFPGTGSTSSAFFFRRPIPLISLSGMGAPSFAAFSRIDPSSVNMYQMATISVIYPR